MMCSFSMSAPSGYVVVGTHIVPFGPKGGDSLTNDCEQIWPDLANESSELLKPLTPALSRKGRGGGVQTTKEAA